MSNVGTVGSTNSILGTSAASQQMLNTQDFLKILITELTFVAPDHHRNIIHKHGHIHLDDFCERLAKFKNELVIASHFSTRYSDQQIRRFVAKQIPDMLDGRLYLWL